MYKNAINLTKYLRVEPVSCCHRIRVTIYSSTFPAIYIGTVGSSQVKNILYFNKLECTRNILACLCRYIEPRENLNIERSGMVIVRC